LGGTTGREDKVECLDFGKNCFREDYGRRKREQEKSITGILYSATIALGECRTMGKTRSVKQK